MGWIGYLRVGEVYTTCGKDQIFIPSCTDTCWDPNEQIVLDQQQISCAIQYKFLKQIFYFEKIQCSTFKLEHLKTEHRSGGWVGTWYMVLLNE